MLTVSAVMAVTATVLSLFGWSVLPYAIGWEPSVVVTGSMVPAIRPGDIIVTAAVDPAELRPGDVIRFVDPARPDRRLMHRIVTVNRDGTLITRGDDNGSADSVPVPPGNIEGVARLRVPLIGSAAVWLREGAIVPPALAAGAAGVVAYVLSGFWAGAWSGRRWVDVD